APPGLRTPSRGHWRCRSLPRTPESFSRCCSPTRLCSDSLRDSPRRTAKRSLAPSPATNDSILPIERRAVCERFVAARHVVRVLAQDTRAAVPAEEREDGVVCPHQRHVDGGERHQGKACEQPVHPGPRRFGRSTRDASVDEPDQAGEHRHRKQERAGAEDLRHDQVSKLAPQEQVLRARGFSKRKPGPPGRSITVPSSSGALAGSIAIRSSPASTTASSGPAFWTK